MKISVKLLLLAGVLVILTSSLALYSPSDPEGGVVQSQGDSPGGIMTASASQATLTYNSNGAYIKVSTDTSKYYAEMKYKYDEGSTVTLEGSGIFSEWGWTAPYYSDPGSTSRILKTFLGWSSSPYGQVMYTGGQVISVDESITLYAIWSPMEVRITQPSAYGEISCNSNVVDRANLSAGTQVDLVFDSDSGHHVKYWVVNGVEVQGSGDSYSFVMTRNTEIAVVVQGQTSDEYGLPTGFRAVEYISNSGNGDGIGQSSLAYIDTGFYPSSETRTVVKYMPTYVPTQSNVTKGSLFGARPNYWSNSYAMWGATSTTTKEGSSGLVYSYKPRSDSGTVQESGQITVQGFDTIILDKSKDATIYNVNGVVKKTAKLTKEDYHTTYSLYIYMVNEGGQVVNQKSYDANPSMAARIYYFQIWEDGVMQRNYVPCRYIGDTPILDSNNRAVSSGTVGLYDTVNGLFYTSPNGVEFYAPEETIHTLGFDGTGGTGGQSVTAYRSVSSLSGMKVSVPQSVSGQTFLGYYLGDVRVFDSSGLYVAELQSYQDYVFEARWDSVKVPFYQNVNSNFQAEGSPLFTESIDPGSQLLIPGIDPGYVPSGATFQYWSDIDGNHYGAGSLVSFNRSTELYAVWHFDQQYVLTIHYCNGSADTTMNAGGEAVLPEAPDSGARIFIEWNTSEDGTGTAYAASAKMTGIVSDTDLYAIWKSVTLSFDACGGTGEADPVNAVVGTVPSSVSVPVKEGFVFMGYTAGNDTLCFDGNGNALQTWVIDRDTELSAMWSSRIYIDLGDGFTYGDSLPGAGWVSEGNGVYSKRFSGHYVLSVTLPTIDPAATGTDVFAGWQCGSVHAATGGCVEVVSGSVFSAQGADRTQSATVVVVAA